MELRSPSQPDRSSESPAEAWHPSQEIEQTELPPADHGKGAWLALLGCVLAQVPIWGKQLTDNCESRIPRSDKAPISIRFLSCMGSLSGISIAD